MKHIKEICKEIANELNIMVPENVKEPECLLKMSDIMPEEEWILSRVTCLVARPGMGKTTLAIELILDAALWMEKPIVYFSLETTEKQLVYRMIRSMIGIVTSGELSVQDMQRLASAIAYIEKLNIFIDDTAGISVSEIESELQKFSEVGMVVIDYIQLVTSTINRVRSRHDEIRWIVQSFLRIAKERQIPVVLLSTLPRSVEFRLNKRPCLEDMYYGVYARDVDQVIFLYRDKVYNQQAKEDSAEIIIAKSRLRINRTVQALFNEKYCRFEKKGRNFDDSRHANLA